MIHYSFSDSSCGKSCSFTEKPFEEDSPYSCFGQKKQLYSHLIVPNRVINRIKDRSLRSESLHKWQQGNACKCRCSKSATRFAEKYESLNENTENWKSKQFDRNYIRKCLVSGLNDMGIRCLDDNITKSECFFLSYQHQKPMLTNSTLHPNAIHPCDLVEKPKYISVPAVHYHCKSPSIQNMGLELRYRAFKECVVGKFKTRYLKINEAMGTQNLFKVLLKCTDVALEKVTMEEALIRENKKVNKELIQKEINPDTNLRQIKNLENRKGKLSKKTGKMPQWTTNDITDVTGEFPVESEIIAHGIMNVVDSKPVAVRADALTNIGTTHVNENGPASTAINDGALESLEPQDIYDIQEPLEVENVNSLENISITEPTVVTWDFEKVEQNAAKETMVSGIVAEASPNTGPIIPENDLPVKNMFEKNASVDSQSKILSSEKHASVDSQSKILSPEKHASVDSQSKILSSEKNASVDSQSKILSPKKIASVDSQSKILLPEKHASVDSQSKILSPEKHASVDSQSKILSPEKHASVDSQSKILSPVKHASVDSQSKILSSEKNAKDLEDLSNKIIDIKIEDLNFERTVSVRTRTSNEFDDLISAKKILAPDIANQKEDSKIETLNSTSTDTIIVSEEESFDSPFIDPLKIDETTTKMSNVILNRIGLINEIVDLITFHIIANEGNLEVLESHMPLNYGEFTNQMDNGLLTEELLTEFSATKSEIKFISSVYESGRNKSELGNDENTQINETPSDVINQKEIIKAADYEYNEISVIKKNTRESTPNENDITQIENRTNSKDKSEPPNKETSNLGEGETKTSKKKTAESHISEEGEPALYTKHELKKDTKNESIDTKIGSVLVQIQKSQQSLSKQNSKDAPLSISARLEKRKKMKTEVSNKNKLKVNSMNSTRTSRNKFNLKQIKGPNLSYPPKIVQTNTKTQSCARQTCKTRICPVDIIINSGKTPDFYESRNTALSDLKLSYRQYCYTNCDVSRGQIQFPTSPKLLGSSSKIPINPKCYLNKEPTCLTNFSKPCIKSPKEIFDRMVSGTICPSR